MTITMTLNDEKKGVELRFSEKPDESIREKMKALRFRYSRPQNMWYAKQVDDTLAFAMAISAGEESAPGTPLALQTPFYPPYSTVDGVNIYPSSKDVSIWDERTGYFADIPALIKTTSDYVMILNLTNAMVPGKTCKRLRVYRQKMYDDRVMTEGMRTFADLYEHFFNLRRIPEGCDAYEDDEKSMRTFSPFVQVKPIKTPDKWTLPHVWKAILSGQIYEGWIDGKYTDDYAYDAATNYSSGRGIHLPSFAADLIDSPGSWNVSVDKRMGNTVQLSINCYHYDCRTLLYDEHCSLVEGERRRAEAEQSCEDQNHALLSQQLRSVENDPIHVYLVDYLEMDSNTDQYVVRTARTTGGYIKQDCTYEFCPIIRQSVETIVDENMYQLYNSIHRPPATDDRRLIWIDEWTVYTTGLAFCEMLNEGYRNDEIGECVAPVAFAEMLADRCTGRVMTAFGNKVDYADMVDRFRCEIQRTQKGACLDETSIVAH